jgi:1,2-dihydroxy-3-keto-5-methylthiopentene dioxygenase
MSALLVYGENRPDHLFRSTTDVPLIAHELAACGVGFERWDCRYDLAATAAPEEVLAAYDSDIQRLKRDHGYLSADVVRIQRSSEDSEWPEIARTARTTFLAEHSHSEDEVRFFAAGSGLFALRANGFVRLVYCEKGDMLRIPAGMRHWFDMGTEPSFCAIRLFGTSDGWIASFTGDPIALRFPTYDGVFKKAM